MKMTLDELTFGLRRLSILMEERDVEPVQLYVVGGFCMLLRGYRDYTQDIDAYYKGNDALLKAIYDVGVEINNPDWLNNDVYVSLDMMNDMPSLEDLLRVEGSMQEWQRFGRITVFVASDLAVMYMKLISFRNDGHSDVEDLMRIAQSVGDVDLMLRYLRKFARPVDDLENMIMNLLMVCFQANVIDEHEYERLYFQI